MKCWWWTACMIAFGTAIACGSNDESGSGTRLADNPSGAGASGPFGSGSGGTSANWTPDSGLPPPAEQEVESQFRAPVATTRFVWSANPESGRVAFIDAQSLEVRLAEARFGPTYLAAVPTPGQPDADAAIVLNVGSHDATLFRVTGDVMATVTLPTHDTANAWAISPSGRWAIAWTDAAQVDHPDVTDGFQEITVLSLEPGAEQATRLSVGYRPVRILFDAAESRAFAVTEPGISVITLGATPAIADLVQVTDDPLEDPASRDVSITPDGAWAVVRRDGKNDVIFVSLATGERTHIDLGSFVTDLDLTADGQRAVAVLRLRSEIVLLDVPAVATDPAARQVIAVVGEDFGSVELSPDASMALLYTTGTPSDRVTILPLTQSELVPRTVSVKAPVKAVFVAPDGEHAIVLMATPPGSSKAGAFSIVPTATALSPKIVGTDAPPTAVALEPGPPCDRALLTVRDDATRTFGVYLLQLASFQVDAIALASAPLATGIVPSVRKGYVAQAYPEGRLTFIALDGGEARTLTGFELAAKVVE